MKARFISYLTKPKLPPRALSISRKEIAAVEARWKKGRLVINRAAVRALPDGVLEPSFEGMNVKSRDVLARTIEEAIQGAGLARERRWAVAIPQGACRTFILELDEGPARKKELAQVLGWKVERLVGVAASELTIAAQRLRPAAAAGRCLAVVARNEVMAAYEAPLGSLGLHPGLVLPTHLAEAGWLSILSRTDSALGSRRPTSAAAKPARGRTHGGDSLLVSIEDELLSMVFVRNGEILALRTLTCSPEGVIDELHRTLVYYQDKLSRVADLREGLPVPAGQGVETGASGSAVSVGETQGASIGPDLRAKPSATGVSVATKALESNTSGGKHELGLIVIINHNEEVAEAKGAGAQTGLPQQVKQLSLDLFLTQTPPTIYSLNEERVERTPSLRLSQVASAVGITGLS